MLDPWQRERWWMRVADWFQRTPVISTIGANLLGIILTWLLDKGPDVKTLKGQAWAGMAVIGIALSLTIAAVVAERTKTLRARRTTQKVIKRLLGTLAEECGHPRCHMRANIMLCDEAKIRRKVDKATAFNMADTDTDKDLELEFGAGVTGKAARSKMGTIGDLTATENGNGPDWGLTPEQRGRVRPTLKTVLSVPIADPDGDGDEIKVAGTLQLDSDCTVEELGWDGRTIDRAQRFADLVALHLEHKS